MLGSHSLPRGKDGTSVLPPKEGSGRRVALRRWLDVLPSTLRTMCIQYSPDMTFIPVPGVAQAKMAGTISGHPFNNIWHYQLNAPGTNWTTAQLNALCDGLMAGLVLTNGIASLTGANTVFNGVTAVDLGIATPATGASTHAAVPGQATGNELPPSTCVLVDLITQERYRGGHARAYMPPGNAVELISTEDQWTTTFVNSYQTAFANMQDNAFSAVPGMHQCCVRYNYTYTDVPAKHKYLATRDSVHSTPAVVNWVVKAGLGTQRRRARLGG